MQNEPCSDVMIESAVAKMRERSTVGIAKHGVTLARKDLSRLDWLRHTQQELMDAVGYLEALIQMEEANG